MCKIFVVCPSVEPKDIYKKNIYIIESPHYIGHSRLILQKDTLERDTLETYWLKFCTKSFGFNHWNSKEFENASPKCLKGVDWLLEKLTSKCPLKIEMVGVDNTGIPALKIIIAKTKDKN